MNKYTISRKGVRGFFKTETLLHGDYLIGKETNYGFERSNSFVEKRQGLTIIGKIDLSKWSKTIK